MSKDEDSLKAVGCLFLAFAVPATVILAPILRGWCLSYLWLWFVAEPFGAPPIGIANCIGLATLIALVTHENVQCKSDKSELADLIALWLFAFVGPLLSLGFGWIVKSFV